MIGREQFCSARHHVPGSQRDVAAATLIPQLQFQIPYAAVSRESNATSFAKPDACPQVARGHI